MRYLEPEEVVGAVVEVDEEAGEEEHGKDDDHGEGHGHVRLARHRGHGSHEVPEARRLGTAKPLDLWKDALNEQRQMRVSDCPTRRATSTRARRK